MNTRCFIKRSYKFIECSHSDGGILCGCYVHIIDTMSLVTLSTLSDFITCCVDSTFSEISDSNFFFFDSERSLKIAAYTYMSSCKHLLYDNTTSYFIMIDFRSAFFFFSG